MNVTTENLVPSESLRKNLVNGTTDCSNLTRTPSLQKCALEKYMPETRGAPCLDDNRGACTEVCVIQCNDMDIFVKAAGKMNSMPRD